MRRISASPFLLAHRGQRTFQFFGRVVGTTATPTSTSAGNATSPGSAATSATTSPAVAVDAAYLKRLRDRAENLRERFSRAASEHRDASTTQVPELAFDVVEAEVVLVDALSQSRDAGEQREALFRGDEAWRGFGLGSKGHHNSKTSTLTEEQAIDYKEDVRLRAERICQRLMSVAVQLRDQELASLWEKRLRTVKHQGSSGSGVQWGAAGLSPAMAASQSQGKSSPNDFVRPSAVPGSRRSTAIPHAPRMGMLGHELDEDEEEIGAPPHRADRVYKEQQTSRPSSSSGQQQEQRPERRKSGLSSDDPGDEGPIDASKFAGSTDEDDPTLSPSDRARENIMSMMRSQQRSVRNASSGAGGNQKHVGRGIDNLRHDLMVEDHPMVRSLFRKKPDVGPRWT
jgi:hypothetical protein